MTNNEAAKIIELNNRYRRGEIDFHQIGYTAQTFGLALDHAVFVLRFPDFCMN